MTCVAKDCNNEFTTPMYMNMDFDMVTFNIEGKIDFDLCPEHTKQTQAIFTEEHKMQVHNSVPVDDSRRWFRFMPKFKT